MTVRFVKYGPESPKELLQSEQLVVMIYTLYGHV
jgi:hypothetical protein